MNLSQNLVMNLARIVLRMKCVYKLKFYLYFQNLNNNIIYILLLSEDLIRDDKPFFPII